MKPSRNDVDQAVKNWLDMSPAQRTTAPLKSYLGWTATEYIDWLIKGEIPDKPLKLEVK